MIKAKPEVEALRPYVAPLEGRRSLLRLDFNESTVGPSPAVTEAIRSLPPEAYATYPEYSGLNEAFAAILNVPLQHVEAFNGVDAAIRAIFDAYGERGATFLTTVPTFGYYEPCAQQQGMPIYAVINERDLAYPLAIITARL
jgi:histidinol-phosphate aminotransferase